MDVDADGAAVVAEVKTFWINSDVLFQRPAKPDLLPFTRNLCNDERRRDAEGDTNVKK